MESLRFTRDTVLDPRRSAEQTADPILRPAQELVVSRSADKLFAYELVINARLQS